jgi:transposase InsO family protein
VRSDWKVSIRRACSTLRIDRALYVYKSKRGDQAALKHRIKDICETRVRYGYRRIHVLLQRDGWAINAKRVYRLYRELSLQLRNKTPKRRVEAKLREARPGGARRRSCAAVLDLKKNKADSGEHKTKRSDLLAVLGKVSQKQPFFYSDTKKNQVVGSLDAKILKSPVRICAHCNNART